MQLPSAVSYPGEPLSVAPPRHWVGWHRGVGQAGGPGLAVGGGHPILPRKWGNTELKAPTGICPTSPQLSQSSLQFRYLSPLGGKKNQDKLVFQVVSREFRLSHGGLRIKPAGTSWRVEGVSHSHSETRSQSSLPLPFQCKSVNSSGLSSPRPTEILRAPTSPPIPSSRPRPLVRPHPDRELYCPPQSSLVRA